MSSLSPAVALLGHDSPVLLAAVVWVPAGPGLAAAGPEAVPPSFLLPQPVESNRMTAPSRAAPNTRVLTGSSSGRTRAVRYGPSRSPDHAQSVEVPAETPATSTDDELSAGGVGQREAEPEPDQGDPGDRVDDPTDPGPVEEPPATRHDHAVPGQPAERDEAEREPQPQERAERGRMPDPGRHELRQQADEEGGHLGVG